MIEILNHWSSAWLPLIWGVVWQSTILALVVLFAMIALRRTPPGMRFWLWQALAIKLLIMPFWGFSIALPTFFPASTAPEAAATPSGAAPSGTTGGARPFWFEAPESSTTGSPSELSEPQAGLAFRRVRWTTWLMILWMGGLALGLFQLIVQRIRLGRLLRASAPLDDAGWTARIEDAAKTLALRNVPRTLVAPGVGSPFVCGLLRPTLVLPRALLADLDEQQGRQVVLHELAHLKRLDLLWAWIPEVACRVYWFHPVAHWVAFRVRLERELACDQVAMAHSGLDSNRYAQTLVHVVTHASTASLRTSHPRSHHDQ